jgi:hypothetical protein
MSDHLNNITSEYNEITVGACETVLRSLIAAIDEGWRNRIVLVGGMVPLYLYPSVPEGIEPHVGTNDLDIGIGVLVEDGDEEAYDTLEKIVGDLKFQPELSWRYSRMVEGVTVLLEFLCPADEAAHPGRKSNRPIGGSGNLHALGIRGVELVPRDSVRVPLDGATLDHGGRLKVDVQVANLLPFLMLKAYAHEGRTKLKDAYDVVWTLVAHPDGPAGAAIAARKSPIVSEPTVKEAIEILRRFYANPDDAGPSRFASFEMERLRETPTDERRAELRRYAHGSVRKFLGTWDSGS